MRTFMQDFKKFITRGNIIDLAVAVIMGAAFGKIIQSLVHHILMPVISLVLGKEGFANYKYIITPADAVNGVAENAIYYGMFIQNIIDFLIVALMIFIVIRLVNKAQDRFNQKLILEAEKKKALEDKAKKQQAILDEEKPTIEDILIDIKSLLESQVKK